MSKVFPCAPNRRKIALFIKGVSHKAEFLFSSRTYYGINLAYKPTLRTNASCFYEHVQHRRTIMNRVKLVTALATVVVAASGSVPAFAETFFAEGVWNSEKNQFEFYDDRLNSSDSSTPYFATFARDGARSVFSTNMDRDNSLVSNSATDWETYEAGFGLSNAYNYAWVYSRYRESSLDHRDHALIDGYSGSIYGNPNVVDLVGSVVNSVLSTSEWGIFNFEQSFIYFQNDSSMSFNEFIDNALYRRGYDGIYRFSTDGNVFVSLHNFEGRHGSITGVTLAYNLSAIPEPETWAMLLAGLGIVGMTAKCRRKVKVN